MKDLKTTIAAVVGAAALIIANFGFDVPADVQTAITALALFVIGLLAKDSGSPEAEGE